jgi:hypothetical protein
MHKHMPIVKGPFSLKTTLEQLEEADMKDVASELSSACFRLVMKARWQMLEKRTEALIAFRKRAREEEAAVDAPPSKYCRSLNKCTVCGIDLGETNPRQLCNKTWCPKM